MRLTLKLFLTTTKYLVHYFDQRLKIAIPPTTAWIPFIPSHHTVASPHSTATCILRNITPSLWHSNVMSDINLTHLHVFTSAPNSRLLPRLQIRDATGRHGLSHLIYTREGHSQHFTAPMLESGLRKYILTRSLTDYMTHTIFLDLVS